jgi:hypothetical protein
VAGACPQHSRYRDPEVPAVAVPKEYVACGAADAADVVAASPAKVLTAAAALPHELADSRIRIVFVAARPTPDNWMAHASVNVHSVSVVNGPKIWKLPTRKL